MPLCDHLNPHPKRPPEHFWAAAEGGGKTYRVNFGGGENVVQSVLSKTTFGGLRNWGWSGRCLFLLREMTESRKKRGGKRIVGGGPKTFLGRGFSPNLRYVFHPPEFSTPLGRSLTFYPQIVCGAFSALVPWRQQ